MINIYLYYYKIRTKLNTTMTSPITVNNLETEIDNKEKNKKMKQAKKLTLAPILPRPGRQCSGPPTRKGGGAV